MTNIIYDYIILKELNPEIVSFRLFEFEAQVRKLDDVLQADTALLGESKVAAMKIDVEGYERLVLKGAEETLRKHKPLVMLESGNRHEGLQDFMASLGFFYAERSGKSLYPVNGIGKASNGFYIHDDNIPAYQKIGILDMPIPSLL